MQGLRFSRRWVWRLLHCQLSVTTTLIMSVTTILFTVRDYCTVYCPWLSMTTPLSNPRLLYCLLFVTTKLSTVRDYYTVYIPWLLHFYCLLLSMTTLLSTVRDYYTVNCPWLLHCLLSVTVHDYSTVYNREYSTVYCPWLLYCLLPVTIILSIVHDYVECYLVWVPTWKQDKFSVLNFSAVNTSNMYPGLKANECY